MDVYLCDRFLCLSNPESWSAFAVVAAANSTQPVPTAADLKAPRLPEWLSGQVRTYAVLDGGCHTLEVFRMIKESESWIVLAESFISQNKTKTKLNNDSLCRYLFAEMFTTCFCSKCVQAFYLILIFWFNARQVIRKRSVQHLHPQKVVFLLVLSNNLKCSIITFQNDPKSHFPWVLSNCSTWLLACSASPKVKNEPRDQKHQWNPMKSCNFEVNEVVHLK